MELLPLFSIFFSTSLIFFLLYALGSGIYFLLSALLPKENVSPYVSLFLKLIFGFLAVIVFTAVYHTHGRTILLIIPIAFLCLTISGLFFSKERLSLFFPFSSEIKPLLATFLFLLVFVVLRLFKVEYFRINNVTPRFLEDDYFYLSIAKFMQLSGIENTTPWYSFFAETPAYVRKPEMYHFSDLWFLTFALRYATTFPIYTLRIVAQAVALGIGWVGFRALFQRYCPVEFRFSDIIFAVLSFILVTQWGYIPKYSSGTGGGFTIMLAFKAANGLLLLQLALLFFTFPGFRKKGWHFGVLCLLPVLNILFAPSVLGALGIIGSVGYWKSREKSALYPLLLSVLTTIWILGFYSFAGSLLDISEGESTVSAKPFGFNLLSAARYCLLTIADYGFHFFPVVVGGIYLYYNVWRNSEEKRKEILPISFFLILLLIMGLSAVFGSMIYYHKEAFQVSYLTFWACNSIFCFFIFAKIIQEKDDWLFFKSFSWAKLFLLLFFLQYLPGQYAEYRPKPMQEKDISAGTTPEFVEKVTERLNGKKLIAYWNPYEPQKGHLCNDCQFTGFVQTAVWAITINTPDSVPAGSDYAVRVTHTPLFSYLSALKSRNQFTDYESAQIGLMKQYGLTELLAKSGTHFPEKIREKITDSITDTGSETRLYILK